jgi:hypothetical protein
MSTAVKAFLNSPVGPKTTHFWGPVANWGFVLAVRAQSSLGLPLCSIDNSVLIIIKMQQLFARRRLLKAFCVMRKMFSDDLCKSAA